MDFKVGTPRRQDAGGERLSEQLFVGRERELEELRGHLGLSLAGQGQVCFIAGQAGSGPWPLGRQAPTAGRRDTAI